MWRFYSDSGSYWVEFYSVECQGWLKTSFLQLVGNMTSVQVDVLLRTPFSLPKKSTYVQVYTVYHSLFTHQQQMYSNIITHTHTHRWKLKILPKQKISNVGEGHIPMAWLLGWCVPFHCWGGELGTVIVQYNYFHLYEL